MAQQNRTFIMHDNQSRPEIKQFQARFEGPIAHQNERMTGAVRKLKEGYGFIAGDDGRDYFFHWSAMERTSKNFRDLEVQERVEFYIVSFEQHGEIKYRAVQVRVLNSN